MQISLRKRFSGARSSTPTIRSRGDGLGLARRARLDHRELGSTVNAWDPWQRYAPSASTSATTSTSRHPGIPLGHGKRFGSGLPGWANAIVGGWQLSGIWRWTSGLPTWAENGGNWPTNWNFAGGATAVREVPGVGTSRLPDGPNLFTDPAAAFAAYAFTRPGQSGQPVITFEATFTSPLTRTSRSAGSCLTVRITTCSPLGGLQRHEQPARFDPFFASSTLSRPATFGRYSDC